MSAEEQRVADLLAAAQSDAQAEAKGQLEGTELGAELGTDQLVEENEWPLVYYPIFDPVDYRIGSVAVLVGGEAVQLAVTDTGFTYPRLPLLCAAHAECETVAEYVAVDRGAVAGIACRRHGPDASLCVDCGTETFPAEYYMVHDAVWPADLGPAGGMLCVGCLETRLGRQLTSADFVAAEINEPDSCTSPRLRARLASESTA